MTRKYLLLASLTVGCVGEVAKVLGSFRDWPVSIDTLATLSRSLMGSLPGPPSSR